MKRNNLLPSISTLPQMVISDTIFLDDLLLKIENNQLNGFKLNTVRQYDCQYMGDIANNQHKGWPKSLVALKDDTIFVANNDNGGRIQRWEGNTAKPTELKYASSLSISVSNPPLLAILEDNDQEKLVICNNKSISFAIKEKFPLKNDYNYIANLEKNKIADYKIKQVASYHNPIYAIATFKYKNATFLAVCSVNGALDILNSDGQSIFTANINLQMEAPPLKPGYLTVIKNKTVDGGITVVIAHYQNNKITLYPVDMQNVLKSWEINKNQPKDDPLPSKHNHLNIPLKNISSHQKAVTAIATMTDQEGNVQDRKITAITTVKDQGKNDILAIAYQNIVALFNVELHPNQLNNKNGNGISVTFTKAMCKGHKKDIACMLSLRNGDFASGDINGTIKIWRCNLANKNNENNENNEVECLQTFNKDSNANDDVLNDIFSDNSGVRCLVETEDNTLVASIVEGLSEVRLDKLKLNLNQPQPLTQKNIQKIFDVLKNNSSLTVLDIDGVNLDAQSLKKLNELLLYREKCSKKITIKSIEKIDVKGQFIKQNNILADLRKNLQNIMDDTNFLDIKNHGKSIAKFLDDFKTHIGEYLNAYNIWQKNITEENDTKSSIKEEHAKLLKKLYCYLMKPYLLIDKIDSIDAINKYYEYIYSIYKEHKELRGEDIDFFKRWLNNYFAELYTFLYGKEKSKNPSLLEIKEVLAQYKKYFIFGAFTDVNLHALTDSQQNIAKQLLKFGQKIIEKHQKLFIDYLNKFCDLILMEKTDNLEFKLILPEQLVLQPNNIPTLIKNITNDKISFNDPLTQTINLPITGESRKIILNLLKNPKTEVIQAGDIKKEIYHAIKLAHIKSNLEIVHFSISKIPAKSINDKNILFINNQKLFEKIFSLIELLSTTEDDEKNMLALDLITYWLASQEQNKLGKNHLQIISDTYKKYVDCKYNYITCNKIKEFDEAYKLYEEIVIDKINILKPYNCDAIITEIRGKCTKLLLQITNKFLKARCNQLFDLLEKTKSDPTNIYTQQILTKIVSKEILQQLNNIRKDIKSIEKTNQGFNDLLKYIKQFENNNNETTTIIKPDVLADLYKKFSENLNQSELDLLQKELKEIQSVFELLKKYTGEFVEISPLRRNSEQLLFNNSNYTEDNELGIESFFSHYAISPNAKKLYFSTNDVIFTVIRAKQANHLVIVLEGKDILKPGHYFGGIYHLIQDEEKAKIRCKSIELEDTKSNQEFYETLYQALPNVPQKSNGSQNKNTLQDQHVATNIYYYLSYKFERNDVRKNFLEKHQLGKEEPYSLTGRNNTITNAVVYTRPITSISYSFFNNPDDIKHISNNGTNCLFFVEEQLKNMKIDWTKEMKKYKTTETQIPTQIFTPENIERISMANFSALSLKYKKTNEDYSNPNDGADRPILDPLKK
jgi:hypothetical protein